MNTQLQGIFTENNKDLLFAYYIIHMFLDKILEIYTLGGLLNQIIFDIQLKAYVLIGEICISI